MSKKIKWFENIDNEWDLLCAGLFKNKQDVYFNSNYLKLYERDDAKINCFVFEKDGSLFMYPFLIGKVPFVEGYYDISTPYGYSGPVANNPNPAFITEAYACFYEQAQKRNVITELIKFHPILGNSRYIGAGFKGRIFRVCSVVCVDINIDEKFRWEKVYSHANRKNINKAKRKKIEVRFDKSEESWREFKRYYEDTMNRNDAGEFYYFNDVYYNNIKRNMADNYILVTGVLEGSIISVLLALLGGNYAYCHLIGTNREFLGTGVNNLLHHELIQWVKDAGKEKLFIGGGRSNDEDDTLLKFKKQFAQGVDDFNIGEYVLNLTIYNQACQTWACQYPEKAGSHKLLKYRDIKKNDN